jgi:hypothetical protein
MTQPAFTDMTLNGTAARGGDSFASVRARS